MSHTTKPTAPWVLIVEDDLTLRRILRMTLQENGFNCTEVGNGADALAVLDGQVPDAVVLDPGLPDSRAKEVLNCVGRFRARGNRGPAVVVMSALSKENVVQQYGPLGGPFLAKPFDPWELARLVNQLLDEPG